MQNLKENISYKMVDENFKEVYNVDDANAIDLNIYRFEAYDKDMHKYIFIKRRKPIKEEEEQ